MTSLAASSYALGAAAFLVLALLLVTAWRGRLQGALLVGATLLSMAWCAAVALNAAVRIPSFTIVALLEVLRDGVWFAFLFRLLGYARGDSSRAGLKIAFSLVCAFCAGLIVYLFMASPGAGPVWAEELSPRAFIFGYLAASLVGLGLVEQLFRNTRPEHRWSIKFLCLGIGGLFAYDFFMYSDALLFRHIDADLWAARGAVNALVVPLLAVSAARNPEWSLEIFVSRHIVFHTATALGAGLYLVLMAGAGYYLQLYGGTWGGVAQAVFLFGAVVLLLLMLFSGQLRSRVKVFVGKHFFKNKYDYREEWLRFTQTLSTSEEDVGLRRNVIRAIADIVESPAGVLWMRNKAGAFGPAAEWNGRLAPAAERAHSSFIRFLETSGWVIYLDEYERDPEHYGDLELPDWLAQIPEPWVVVPLMHRDELLGFIVLTRSRMRRSLNWEDSDLLKTVGRQAASYLALLEANEALSESRQFEAFNRLSAYVVHDLKNLVAQLSLVGVNAKRHMSNPAFIEDAVATVEHATAKMNRLLGHLRKDRLEETSSKLVNLRPLLQKIIESRAIGEPVPELVCESDGLIVRADPDRLGAVLEHLIQNAQEATPPDGRVTVRTSRESEVVLIKVEDTGCGMDEQFIRERLFRPFDTTKGNAGMGIGVYESREFITARGGQLEVTSEPGQGTTFWIRLPSELEGSMTFDVRARAGAQG